MQFRPHVFRVARELTKGWQSMEGLARDFAWSDRRPGEGARVMGGEVTVEALRDRLIGRNERLKVPPSLEEQQQNLRDMVAELGVPEDTKLLDIIDHIARKHGRADLRQILFDHFNRNRLKPPAMEDQWHRGFARRLSQTFARTVAGLIHGHSSRAHKIARSDATGEDVWQGYEKNALKAIVLAGNGIAGGSAKRAMAQTMMAGIMGTTESWRAFRAAHPELEDEEACKAYKDQMDARRIDGALQPVAYREATALMREMVRNEEPLERIIGVARGLAALKYLSGITSALINMLSLATYVPAVMLDRGGIPLARAPRLLKDALEGYGRFYLASKFPDRVDVAPPSTAS